MGELFRLKDALLSDGCITRDEVQTIREYIDRNGQLDLDDIKLLVALLSDAREVCSEFDDLFFPALKHVILQDGRVGPDEQFYLLKMLYSDGRVRENEKRFLRELRAELTESTPEFEALCQTAFATSGDQWCVGGR